MIKRKLGASDPGKPETKTESLRDELGIQGLSEPVMGGRGRLFSAAGRESPIAEFTEEYVILHAPQNPFDAKQVDDDKISERVSPRGVLLSAIGNEIKISGAKFRGYSLYCLAARNEETGKRLVGYFDDAGKLQSLITANGFMSYHEAVNLRNKTHNGDITNTPGIASTADL